MNDSQRPYLLTVRQVARILAIPESTTYALAEKGLSPFDPGGIEVLRMGKNMKRFRVIDVERYIGMRIENPDAW